MTINPIRALPGPRSDQPAIVAALDHIRFALDDEEHAEFCWFAREYPRIFRYHLYHAEHRLEQIHHRYEAAREMFGPQVVGRTDLCWISTGRGAAWEVYWEFEAYLNAINSALDILARVVGLFYIDPAPVSFNKLCAKVQLSGVVDLLRRAQRRWVSRVKDYRDCFVHYTPVDNESFIHCVRYADGWQVRCSLPVNPNVRETDGFRFRRRTELLQYAITTYRNLRALERQIGRLIRADWRGGAFPRRIHNLFFVASRQRTPPNNALNPPVRRVTALAENGKRRATRPAG